MKTTRILKRKAFLVAGIIFCTVAVSIVLNESARPRFQGKTLAGWIASLRSVDSEERAHAQAALEAMGTNEVRRLRRLVHDPQMALEAGMMLAWIAPEEAKQLAREWSASTNRSIRARGQRLEQEFWHIPLRRP